MKIIKISERLPLKDTDIPKKECPECHGKKFVYKKLKNLGTLDWNEHLLPCDTCSGKGYITQKDIDAYRHRVGIIPHPIDGYSTFNPDFAWYCPTCDRDVQNEHVTFQETHDPRCGGCGNPVEPNDL